MEDALDLREFVGQVLETAKDNLTKDGCLLPVAFIVTGEGIGALPVVFKGQEEKEAAYRQVVELAKANQALAIVTLNDARYQPQPTAETLESYYPGKLAAEQAPECIILSVSGPAIPSWTVRVPYQRTEGNISFGSPVESTGDALSLLEGWAVGGVKPS